jgi:hypothetical protein
LDKVLALLFGVFRRELLWLGRRSVDRGEELEDIWLANARDGDVVMTSAVGFDDGRDYGGVLEDVVVGASDGLDAVWRRTTLNDRADEDDRRVVKDVIDACIDGENGRIVETVLPMGLNRDSRDDSRIVKDRIKGSSG